MLSEEGVSHAIGVGGRDLTEKVAARSTRQALELLAQDSSTQVIVLVSKPPDGTIARQLLSLASRVGKPVVVAFVGLGTTLSLGNVELAGSLQNAADLAMTRWRHPKETHALRPSAGRLVGLFSGGTLALEVAHGMLPWLSPLTTNLGLSSGLQSEEPPPVVHTILDLGGDEFTVGRPHPMIDGSLRLERLRAAAKDPSVGTLLLDLVLGHGAHPDPAAALAHTIRELLGETQGREKPLRFGVLLVGSQYDPQDLASQKETLVAAGAEVFETVSETIEFVALDILPSSAPSFPEPRNTQTPRTALDPSPVINVGLESFVGDFSAQEAEVVVVDWRPPAGGNPILAKILHQIKERERAR